jgi:hypothetical protein
MNAAEGAKPEQFVANARLSPLIRKIASPG